MALPHVSSPWPPELIANVQSQAALDADDVAHFFALVGITPQGCRNLPAWLLLGLGVAMRLTRWELRGIDLHLRRGMAEGKALALEVLRRYASSTDTSNARWVHDLYVTVIRIGSENLRWSVDESWESAVSIETSGDDGWLDALAWLVWHQRKALGGAGGQQQVTTRE